MVEVVFYRGEDWLSRGIKWWTKGTYSHCGYRLWGCLVIDIDAVHGMRARFDPWQQGDITSVMLNRDPVEELIALYQSRWARYSVLEGLRKHLPWIPDSPERVNCAEMVYDREGLGPPDQAVFPDDVLRLLRQQQARGD